MLARRATWDAIFSSSQSPSEWYYSLTPALIDDLLVSVKIPRPWVVYHCGCGIYPIRACSDYPVVINVDYSVEIVAHITRSREAMSTDAVVADICRFCVHSESVDVIIEKGLFDSMTSDSRVAIDHAQNVLREYWRVLRYGGAAIILSIFGPNAEEKDMLGLLSHPEFQLEYKELFMAPAEIPSQQFCFVYVCHKVNTVV
jgi:SAM-dependent methyltransferase